MVWRSLPLTLLLSVGLGAPVFRSNATPTGPHYLGRGDPEADADRESRHD